MNPKLKLCGMVSGYCDAAIKSLNTRMHFIRMRTVHLSACWDIPPRAWTPPPPPVNRMTDRCNNITFLQLRLRTVIKESNMEWYLFMGPVYNENPRQCCDVVSDIALIRLL